MERLILENQIAIMEVLMAIATNNGSVGLLAERIGRTRMALEAWAVKPLNPSWLVIDGKLCPVTDPEEDVEKEKIDAGVRFLERWGVGSELAHPEFVAEFLDAVRQPSSEVSCGRRAPRRLHRRSVPGDI